MFIYQNKGFYGFYNGLLVNWIKGFLATGLSFTFHEKIEQMLSRTHIEYKNCSDFKTENSVP
jgi:hypothetical protein